MEPEEGQEKAPKVPDSVIRAALLRRAVEDIHRIIQIRTAKAACSSLLQRGSVGDDLWQRFQRAEKEMEEELRDVVMEVRETHTHTHTHACHLLTTRPVNSQANALVPGWGQFIFQSAHEIAANKVLRDRLDEVEAQAERDREWWAKRRAAIQDEFMKELESESSEKKQQGQQGQSTNATAAAGSEDEAVLVDTNTPSAAPAAGAAASKKKKGKKQAA